MKDFEKIEKLLKSKSYSELSSDERSLIESELTQEVYEELRQAITQVQREKLQVNKSLKKSLMKEFKETNNSRLPVIFRWKIPALTHIIPLVVIVYLAFFMPKNERVITQDRIVEIMVRDTVQINQVDTLYLERIVKVPTPVYVTREPKQTTSPEKIQTVNRSLSDQKEVLDLVVRGLE